MVLCGKKKQQKTNKPLGIELVKNENLYTFSDDS